MKLALDNNVYVVRGAKRACIYDLNNAKLYAISSELADVIENLSASNAITNNPIVNRLMNAGILCNEAEKRDLITVEMPRLKNATLEITQTCNFQCAHCYEGMQAGTTMPTDEAISILEKLRDYGMTHIHIIGGEPLIHSGIIQILEHCATLFESVLITTNASLLTSDTLEVIARNNIAVAASLHSDNVEGFERVTGVDAYETVRENISKLAAADVNVEVRSVKLSDAGAENPHGLYGHRMSGYPALVGYGSLGQYSIEMLCEKAITESYFKEPLVAENVLQNMQINPCFCRGVYIDVFQNVYPCILERRICHGNLTGKSLEDVLDESLFRLTKDTLSKCAFCEYRYACNTCFADTGSADIKASPWFCSYDPLNGKWGQLDEWAQKLKRCGFETETKCWRNNAIRSD